MRKINPSPQNIETNVSNTNLLLKQTEQSSTIDSIESNEDNVFYSNVHNDTETKVLSYKFIHLNINGWTSRNSKLRQKILLSCDADFVSINETHERYEGLISLPGYVWFGAKRIKQHMKSVRAFGGVGMFVRNFPSKSLINHMMVLWLLSSFTSNQNSNLSL